jgi:hypothetical protein
MGHKRTFGPFLTTARIERDFPHHVELMVPEGGFRKRLDEMHEQRLCDVVFC